MFPDVEKLLVAYLKPLLSVSVSTVVPNPRPSSFVRLYRTGGAANSRVVERAQVTFESWGSTRGEASDLSRNLRHLLLGSSKDIPLVRSVGEISGVYYDPDTDTNIDRFTFTLVFTIRAHF